MPDALSYYCQKLVKLKLPAYTLEDQYRDLILAAEPLPGYGDQAAEETAQLEQALFRRTVVEAYEGCCAVTGLRHTLHGRAVLVDAHHIQGSSLNSFKSASTTS